MVGLCRHSRKEFIMTARRAHSAISTLDTASTDIELVHRLANFLSQQHVPDVDCVRLDARGGVLVVSGALTSHHAKWLCIECCRRVAGVVAIVDHLDVAAASVKFPGAVQTAAEPKTYGRGRRNSIDYHGNRLFNHDTVSEFATQRADPTSRQSRLHAAA